MHIPTEQFFGWVCEAHTARNHMYDTYLPYEFHLRLTRQVGNEYKHLVPAREWNEVESALGGHDVIENADKSFNDVKEALKRAGFIASDIDHIAEMIYACTDKRGRNRAERHDDDYYDLIRRTPMATFVKLADAIANVRYSKMVKSDKTDMYRKEFPDFERRLRNVPTETAFSVYEPMFKELEALLIK